MKSYIAAFLFLAIGIAFAQPVAVVEESSFDFGQLEEGPEATHHFMIRNEGDSTLKIVNVRSS